MSAIVPFTGNLDDLSNDKGYQFEFYCERSDVAVTGRGLLRAAGGLFGGALGNLP